ncbi:hypothetical protein FS935_08865 [Metabacillus litoralis]|uniref:Uncharacterized protein n=1 Tax=Metabacillus litoralis TaxID=152268 RepID=A0A5C6VZK4_9BACI|nr:hypothetical protein [Metabacillus litoralis]TXC91008.1 hypothetical protein FS935_08865 [Metabacillus litoralis]
MKNSKVFMILMTLLPWLSIPFLKKKTLIRFLPSVLFMSLILTAEGYFAEKKKWWWFPFHVKPNVIGELPLILGPFIVGSFWILKFTYGKFNLYMLINTIVDSFFTYFILDWFKKMGYASLVKITKFQLSLSFLIKSLLMYGFQVGYDKVIGQKNTPSQNKDY